MSITSVRSRPAFTSLDAFSWPGDFARIPDEEWTQEYLFQPDGFLARIGEPYPRSFVRPAEQEVTP